MNYSQDHIVKMMIKSTESVIKILQKAQTWSTENGRDEVEILQTRLAPDMFPLTKQIQIISDNLKGTISRLSMTETPKMEDNETTLSELIQRLEKTIEFAKSVSVENLSNSENQKIILPFMPSKYLETLEYLFNFAIPNLYFHISMVYAILRHIGVPIGKMDFIGGLEMHDLEN